MHRHNWDRPGCPQVPMRLVYVPVHMSYIFPWCSCNFQLITEIENRRQMALSANRRRHIQFDIQHNNSWHTLVFVLAVCLSVVPICGLFLSWRCEGGFTWLCPFLRALINVRFVRLLCWLPFLYLHSCFGPFCGFVWQYSVCALRSFVLFCRGPLLP